MEPCGLCHQPQILCGGGYYGAEALVRWQHPEQGLISPLEFIPLAEETGHIVALGTWVLEEGCRQLARWATQPHTRDWALAVNVSAMQFLRPDFIDTVRRIVESSGIRPDRLKLELTESLLVDDDKNVIQSMHALKQMGIQLALDDFGTGSSSLAYLKNMPLDQLKIDQTFVSDMLLDSNAATITKSIATLAHSLGLTLVAEDVETPEQRNFLAGLGCSIYQGYYYSRPLPVEEFERYLLGEIEPE